MTYKQWFLDKFKAYPGASCRFDFILESLVKRKGFHGFIPKLEEPCFRCSGYGGYKVSSGPYDCCDWETCDLCKGSGKLLKHYYKTWFKEFKEKEKERKLKERNIAKELTRIKSKITKKELEFLLTHIEK